MDLVLGALLGAAQELAEVVALARLWASMIELSWVAASSRWGRPVVGTR